ncbi:MAG: crossover junction endodeoxyribonuclease RuvC [Sulfurospirillum sp.]|nr:crossover junction endodeoxyribonuclease RuvC [Sulfurospirillum sp.]
MFILGIDPGTRNCGYAILQKEKNRLILVEAGLIKIKEKILQHQIMELVEGLDTILKHHHIDEVAIEDIFYAYNPQTVLKLAQFRGALSLKILQVLGNFSEYTPLQVKKAVTGNGKAAKEQSWTFMVKKILGIKQEIKPLDITDAIAIAITTPKGFKRLFVYFNIKRYLCSSGNAL